MRHSFADALAEDGVDAHALKEALRQLLRLPRGAARGPQIAAAVVELLGPNARSEPGLSQFLVDELLARASAPGESPAHLWARFASAVARHRPLVLVLEDVHEEPEVAAIALNMAERAGLIVANPLRRVRKPPNRQRGYPMLTPGAIDSALVTIRASKYRCAQRDADIVELSHCLSLRRRELSRIEAGHIDLDAARLFVIGKNGEPYYPISERARPILERFLARGCSPLVGSEGLIEKAFERWSKRLGLAGRFSPQVMRHSFADALAEDGVDAHALKDAMRHSNLRTTQRYVHESRRVRAVLDALPRGRSPAASPSAPVPSPPPSAAPR